MTLPVKYSPVSIVCASATLLCGFAGSFAATVLVDPGFANAAITRPAVSGPSAVGDLPMIRVQSGMINGNTVSIVEFETGRYELESPGTWREYGPEGAYGTLRETARTANSVFLRDDANNVDFEFDLVRGEIIARGLNATSTDRITRASSARVAAPPAPTPDPLGDMAWTNYQFNDESNRGRMTSQIVVGVPETDAILASASCFAGSTAGLPMIELNADIGNRRNGDILVIEFLTDVGRMVYSGEAMQSRSSEEPTRVRISPGFNDPLWSALKRMSQVAYRIGGRETVLPLRGSSRAINRFLSECAIYQGTNVAQPPRPVPAAPPAPQPPLDPRWATCDRLANVVSRNSDNPVTVTFRNRSDGFRTVMWIGFDGVPKEYAALNPGEEFTINTFLTHPWMFTDGPGNCLEMFMPQFGVSVFNITAPNRDFGSE